MTKRSLPCGCRHCGCACPDHAPPYGWLCDGHAAGALAKVVATETLALVSVALFVSMVLVWAGIFALV